MNGGVEHVFGPRSTTAIGSLPHRDPVGAATCAFAATTLPCIPSLPRRSPAEGMVAQAVGSLPGVTLGQYGSISIDPSRFGSDIVVGADLRGESFGGLRAFLDLAVRRDHRGPVKWQFIGPVTLGLSLRRAAHPAPSPSGSRSTPSVPTSTPSPPPSPAGCPTAARSCSSTNPRSGR
ncbi:MAG: hypothetical protein WKF58_03985 [Ilumatobacteraceae bacterium]